MIQANENKSPIKYLTPANLYAQLNNFTAGMAVTKGEFELIIPQCTLKDIEWNHMDQMHRFSIHNTYEKGVRIATGKDFAISLTQWGKWPFLISVTDVYVAEGLFYQSLTLAGIIFLHSIISMEQVGDSVKLKDEWYIASHKLFKLLHWPLNKKLHKLNARLQDEDQQIRQGRFLLRKAGYKFTTDQPDYYNSNVLGRHTIYPELQGGDTFSLEGLTEQPQSRTAGNLQFVVKKKDQDIYMIWPAACPHEGGPLLKGKFCDAKVSCPWHGLQFRAAEISTQVPQASAYGFEYKLEDNQIQVKQLTTSCKTMEFTEDTDDISI